jgi:hypothetical protein
MPDDADKKDDGGEPGQEPKATEAKDLSATPPPVEAKVELKDEAKPVARPEAKADARLVSAQKPASPWPSARKGDSGPPPAKAKEQPAPESREPKGAKGAAWGEPLAKLDAKWTKLEAGLCVFVLSAEIFVLCLWITLKGMSAMHVGGDVSGLVFRALFGATALGLVAHKILLPRGENADKKEAETRHRYGVLVAIALGLFGAKLWVNGGVQYSSNFLNWMQNASVVMLFGGLRSPGLVTRLTLWLALLGASMATAKGKHINVDVVMRFLTPKLRVPAALVGWLAAAVMCLAAVWGFTDHIAIEDFKVQRDLEPGKKIEHVMGEMKKDWFLFCRQLSLDLKSFPKVVAGTKYDGWMTGAEWNEWMKEGDWTAHFSKEEVEGQMKLPEQVGELQSPAVNWPGGGENIRGLLIRDLNFVFPFGLLVIGLRFLLRCLLTLSGHIRVDPDAAHEDEDLHAKHAADDDAIAAAQQDVAREKEGAR